MLIIFDKNTLTYIGNTGTNQRYPTCHPEYLEQLKESEGYYILHDVEKQDSVNKILEGYPFDLVFEGYNVVDIVFYNKPEITPTKDEINIQVISKIRENYSVDDEFQMQRLGLQDSSNAEFQEYLTYVNQCVEWGRLEKEKYVYV